MAPLLGLTHLTRYAYAAPARLGPQCVRLVPRPRPGVLAHGLTVRPAPARLDALTDAHGNALARVVLEERVAELTIEVRVAVDLAPANPFDFLLDEEAAQLPVAYGADDARELRAFLDPAPTGPRGEALLAGLSPFPRASVPVLIELNRRLYEGVTYLRRDEPGVRAPEETLALGEGSCRDTAWLHVALLRRLGLAARFVSGYLVEAREEGDTAELHAWAETWLPGAGWIGFDATSGLLAARGHVALAAAAHPRGAAPLSGLVEAVPATLETTTTVRRLSAGEADAFAAGG